MAGKLRVVFFSFGILEQGGGFENFLLQITPVLDKKYKSLDIEIVTCSDRLTSKLQNLLSIYYLKKHSQSSIHRETNSNVREQLGSIKYFKADSLKDLKQILKTHDVIHTKNEILELAVLKWFGFKNLPPIITGIHTPIVYPYSPSMQSRLHNVLYKFTYKKLLNRLAGVYVQNDEDYQLLKNDLGYRRNLQKIDQGMKFKDNVAKHNNTVKLHILFVGRITEQKGIDILIQTINILKNERSFKNMEFRIIGRGDPDLTNNLTNMASKYSNVTYYGHVAHQDITEHYEWSDFVVIPSRYETLCKVAMEAGANNKFAICSNIPGPREVIIDNKTGFLLELKPELFADKIKQLQQLKRKDKTSFYNVGQRAYDYIRKKFDIDVSAQQLHAMLKDAYEES